MLVPSNICVWTTSLKKFYLPSVSSNICACTENSDRGVAGPNNELAGQLHLRSAGSNREGIADGTNVQ